MRKTLLLVCAALLVSAPAAVAQVDTVTVCDVQDGTEIVGTEVFIDSVIVTAIDLKPSTFGYWVQQNRPCKIYADYSYSGVLVYCDQARPDTMGGGGGLEIGDLVQVRGYIQEYPSGGVPSVTEIQGSSDMYAAWVKILAEDYGEPHGKYQGRSITSARNAHEAQSIPEQDNDLGQNTMMVLSQLRGTL